MLGKGLHAEPYAISQKKNVWMRCAVSACAVASLNAHGADELGWIIRTRNLEDVENSDGDACYIRKCSRRDQP